MNLKDDFSAFTACFARTKAFSSLLWQEIEFRRNNSLDSAYLELKYENNLFKPGGEINLLTVAAYASRLITLLQEIESRENARLLDAGCGCGSESIMAAMAGAEVTGIDLVPLRCEYAQSRLPFFREKSGRPLAVDFQAQNVLAHLAADNHYDIIWANEAVSHIHPAEDFFSAACQALRPGGVLIIADSNGQHPLARRRAARIRGHSNWYLQKQFKYFDDQEHDEVAEERLFSAYSLGRLLRRRGFTVRRVVRHGFLGSSFWPLSWQYHEAFAGIMLKFQHLAANIPLVRRLGSSMTVVAEIVKRN